MRTTCLSAALAVAVLLVFSCKQDPDYVLPSLQVGTETVNFSSGSEQSFGILANRDWMVKSKPDWLAVDPDHGTASDEPQWVTVTALPNDSYDRTGSLVFTIGLAKAGVEVIQPGEKGPKSSGTGTLEDPYTVSGAVAYISSLPADEATTANVYIKGKISSITEAFSAQYGNATFYIADEEGDAAFYVYRTLYLGNKKWTANDKQIAEGDEVVICGQVVNYRGNTPETVINKSYVYSLNGESQGSGGGGDTPSDGGTPAGTGTLADPYNVAGVNAYVASLADNAKSETDVYIKGKVSKVKEAYSAQFGNGTFYIQDEGADGDFYVYRALYLGGRKWKDGDTQVQVGDEVVVCGKVTKYVSQYGTTPETVQNEAYLYSLNGKTADGGDNPDQDGQGGTDPVSGTTVFAQAFKTAGQGSFTIDNKNGLPEGLSYVWSYDSRYGMKASGFLNNVNYATESWLVSPEIDLSAAKKPVLTFRHALNFFANVARAKEEATLWAQESGGAWKQLSGVQYPESLSWTFVDSGEIDLSAYAGKKVRIAFKYVSTAEKAGTWEVDDFKIVEK